MVQKRFTIKSLKSLQILNYYQKKKYYYYYCLKEKYYNKK